MTPFDGLKKYNQFVLWKSAVQADGSIKKFVIHPETGKIHDPHDPVCHMSYTDALRYGSQIGFVFTEHDPYFFLDIDDCLESSGQWSENALNMCSLFAGCAVEVSISGSGLHVIGTMPESIPHSCDNKLIGSQFYTEKRFVALTFRNAIGNVDHVPGAYQWFVQTYFPEKPFQIPTEWTTEPVPEYTGPEDDDQLIEKMLKSKSAATIFGSRASLESLWAADPEELNKFYPDPNRPFDWSDADSALCTHLAFWTGKNCERIDRLFRRSGLYRDKWENREGYRYSTIIQAVGVCSAVYTIPKKLPATDDVFLSTKQQVDYFNGCVYIQALHKIFTPDGYIIPPEVFRVAYSGNKIFHLDDRNDKTTKNAWKAFTESEINPVPMSHSTCFRPELTPGVIIEEEGQSLVNTYVPIKTDTTPGDISPFMELLKKLLPEAHDRDIVLAYMAACVRNPGVKFQWCPVLQGAPGNGKTFIGSCLAKAVGERYTHTPNANQLAGRFNGWLFQKLLIVVEEIYVPKCPEIMEALKPMITNLRIEFQSKGANQFTADNRANFFMSTNYREGVRKSKDDRRFCIFFTAQQTVEDIKREMMTDDYFHKLYSWARNGGYQSVSHYLKYVHTYPYALDPASGCQRAPDTTTTSAAILASKGPAEQDVLEAIWEAQPGFTNNWISSIALTRLLDKWRLSHSRKSQLLDEIGYVPHPHLPQGRLGGIIPEEGGRPKLYVRQNCLHCNITDPQKIREMYCKDQGYTSESRLDYILEQAKNRG